MQGIQCVIGNISLTFNAGGVLKGENELFLRAEAANADAGR